MTRKSLILFWNVILAATILFSAVWFLQMLEVARIHNINIFHSVWIFLLSFILLAAILGIILLILLATKWQDRLLEVPEAIRRVLGRWKFAPILFLIILLPVYPCVTLHPYLGRFYANGSWTHLALFWWLCLGLMVCLKSIRQDLSWFAAIWLGALISAAFYIAAKQFLTVTNYPFALTWSEASRFYGASLFFSNRIYGERLPLGIMHVTWHLLLSIPFLFGNLPIWLHRLWWALLQLVLGIAVSWSLANRFGLSNKPRIWIAAGWVFVFLFPLPILVHLLFCSLLVLWGVKPKKFWRTTIIVVLASVWAGLSRINWFPVPGIIAAILYLLEVPFNDSRNLFKYLWKPIFWIPGGTLIALASNLVFMQLSGNGSGVSFSSSLTSGLLWYRLLPNPTYAGGILLNLLLLAGPVIVSIILCLRHWRKTLHPLRLVGIASALGILLAGGLVVSVKIGGGSDLHNLDAFLILLVIIGGYLYFGSYASESLESKPFVWQSPILLALLLITPVWIAIRLSTTVLIWDKAQADRTLALIRRSAEDISKQGGKVLFISQRQLLTLKMVNIPLVPEYEQDFLTEMVMSNNQTYLDQFHKDLRTQRFAAIVIDAQNVHFYGRTESFGEENDVWVRAVSIPLLCYYEPQKAFTDLSEVVYIPRSQPCQ